MSVRTSIILDDATHEAARQLAATYGCTISEAIRRAIVQQRDRVTAVSEARREARRGALEKLIEITEGEDPEAEVARIKAEDAHE